MATSRRSGGSDSGSSSIWADVDEAATESDRIEDTVDYRRLAALVREVFAGPERLLLEGLAGTIADGPLARFEAVERVRVRVRKPDVVLDPPVDPRGRRRRAHARLSGDARVRRARREPRRPRGDDPARGRASPRRTGSRCSRSRAPRDRPGRLEDQPRFLNGAAALETTLARARCWTRPRVERELDASGTACASARARSTSTSCSTAPRSWRSRPDGAASAAPRATLRARAARGARSGLELPGRGRVDVLARLH